MALLQHKSLADYEKQVAAFEDFLDKFETSKTSEDLAAEAIDNLNLDEDHTSDEYDFMDDVANGDSTTTRRQKKRKYRDMLQDVANRECSNILVELDDLKEVRFGLWPCPTFANSKPQFEDSLGDEQNLRLVESITKNTKHYIDLFADAVDKAMPKPSKEIT